MKTKSELFVETRIDRWRRLHSVIKRIPSRKLSRDEILEFPSLYRQSCADLAESQMYQLSPDVLDYLNSLVGTAHRYLYTFPPLKKSAFHTFFSEYLPGIVGKHYKFAIISALFFLMPFFAALIGVQATPSIAGSIVSPDVLEAMEANYAEGLSSGHTVGESSFATSFYIQHNISIAFYSVAAGVFIGLGTIYFLVYNGLTLGAIMGYVSARGYSANLIEFICAHSVFEISGLIIAGAAGLFLGYTILNGGRKSRQESLKSRQADFLTLVCAAALLIFTAAFIEGGVSPRPDIIPLKIAIILTSLSVIIGYFIIWPGMKKQRKKPA